jgi:sec-independent protein translocase protein TatA
VIRGSFEPREATHYSDDMGNVGPLELVVVAIIALIVFGPKRVPELGRSLGKGIREFKASLEGSDDDEDSRERQVGTTNPSTPSEPPPSPPVTGGS